MVSTIKLQKWKTSPKIRVLSQKEIQDWAIQKTNVYKLSREKKKKKEQAEETKNNSQQKIQEP